MLLALLPSTVMAKEGLDLVVGLDERGAIQARLSARAELCSQRLRDISVLNSQDYARFGLASQTSREISIVKASNCVYRISAGLLPVGSAANFVFKVTTDFGQDVVRVIVRRSDPNRIQVTDQTLPALKQVDLSESSAVSASVQYRKSRPAEAAQRTLPAPHSPPALQQNLSTTARALPPMTSSSSPEPSEAFQVKQPATSPMNFNSSAMPLAVASDHYKSQNNIEQGTILLATCFVLALVFFFSVIVIFLSRNSARDLAWQLVAPQMQNRQPQPTAPSPSFPERPTRSESLDQFSDIVSALARSAAHEAAAERLSQIKMSNRKAMAEAEAPPAAPEGQSQTNAPFTTQVQAADPQPTTSPSNESSPPAASKVAGPSLFKIPNIVAVQHPTVMQAPIQERRRPHESSQVADLHVDAAANAAVPSPPDLPKTAQLKGNDVEARIASAQPKPVDEAAHAAHQEKLDMANVYFNMGDWSAARVLLQDIAKSGSVTQIEEALRLLAQIEDME